MLCSGSVLWPKQTQHLIYPGLKLTEAIELFKEPIFKILEVKRKFSLANGVALAERLISLPVTHSIAFQFKETLEELRSRRAILFSMGTYWKSLLLDLRSFDIGLEVHSALILIMPIFFIKLDKIF